MERNKQYVVDPPTVEKCRELSKQLFYTRLARYLYYDLPDRLLLLRFVLTHYTIQLLCAPMSLLYLFRLLPDVCLLMCQIASDLVLIAWSNAVGLVLVCQFRFASLWCTVACPCCSLQGLVIRRGHWGCKRL
jgi:hypothetical protein